MGSEMCIRDSPQYSFREVGVHEVVHVIVTCHDFGQRETEDTMIYVMTSGQGKHVLELNLILMFNLTFELISKSRMDIEAWFKLLLSF